MTTQQASDKWNTSIRSVQNLCREGRVDGAERWGHTWMIPSYAAKPMDKRIRQIEQPSSPELTLKAPKQCPMMMLTDLFQEPGCAEKVIAETGERNAAALMEAWLAYSRGDIRKAICLASSLRSVDADPCAAMSIGLLLAACSLWKGDLHLWMEGRAHIQNVQCTNKFEHSLRQMSLATTDEGLLDNTRLPEWFQKGHFEALPADSYPAAGFYYSKHLYLSAKDLATGKIKLKEMDGFGLMRTLPYLIEPFIAHAKAAGAAYAEAHLHGLCAKVYYDLGDRESAVYHMDETFRLALPDRLYGILAELRSFLSSFMEERLERFDPSAAKEIRKLQKDMLIGFSKMSQTLRNVQLVTTLSSREQDVAQLAALGLSNPEISERLRISVSSVKATITMIMNKSGTQKRSEFAKFIV